MIKLNFIITFIIDLIVISYILYWLYHLDKIKCTCALNERRKQIIKFWYFILFLMFGLLIVVIISGNSNIVYITISQNNSYIIIYNIFITIVTLLSVYNAYNTYKYIKDLDENKCNCSLSVHRKVIYYYAITSLVIAIVLFFLMLFIVIYFSFYCDKKCMDYRKKKYRITYAN